jgi:hypothetical protein
MRRATDWRAAVEVLDGLQRMRYYPGPDRMAALVAVVQASLDDMPAPSIVRATRACSSLQHCPTPTFLAAALEQVG